MCTSPTTLITFDHQLLSTTLWEDWGGGAVGYMSDCVTWTLYYQKNGCYERYSAVTLTML